VKQKWAVGRSCHCCEPQPAKVDALNGKKGSVSDLWQSLSESLLMQFGTGKIGGILRNLSGWWFGSIEFYDFPYIGNVIIPTDFHSIIFSEGLVAQPPTSYDGLAFHHTHRIHGAAIYANINGVY
jgi:hypothetical protein